MDKILSNKTKRLFEDILNKNPKYINDIRDLYNCILLEGEDSAYEHLIELLIKLSYKDDLKDLRKDIAETLLFLIDTNNVVFSF